MIALSGPAVLSILALVVFSGAAVAVWLLANRNYERPRSREERR